MQFHSHITSNQVLSNEALFNGANLDKQLLAITFDDTELVVSINKKLVPPISWFLTDELGDLIHMGQISNQSFKINLSGLSRGTYSLRIAGEVITINNRA